MDERCTSGWRNAPMENTLASRSPSRSPPPMRAEVGSEIYDPSLSSPSLSPPSPESLSSPSLSPPSKADGHPPPPSQAYL